VFDFEQFEDLLFFLLSFLVDFLDDATHLLIPEGTSPYFLIALILYYLPLQFPLRELAELSLGDFEEVRDEKKKSL
jgi:hypothetical protein